VGSSFVEGLTKHFYLKCISTTTLSLRLKFLKSAHKVAEKKEIFASGWPNKGRENQNF